jgi:hypothetical protein
MESSIGEGTVELEGTLGAGETLRIGSAGVDGVDVVIADGALASGPGGFALLESDAPADGTGVLDVAGDNVTGMVYVSTDMVFGISHLRVPANNAIYECIYGGSGQGPFNAPFNSVTNCLP